MSTQLIGWLAEGVTVITVNRRLARMLRDSHDIDRMARGDRVWASPPVMTLPDFIQREYTRLRDELNPDWPAMLGPEQEALLWEEAIRRAEGPSGSALQNVAALARGAASAHALLARWMLDSSAVVEPCTDDAHAFRRWARAFEDICSRDGWVTATGAMLSVCRAFESGAASPPARFALVGFDDPPPLLRSLVEGLRSAGAQCLIDDRATESPAAVAIAFDDERTEIEAAARWSRALVESVPGARIGIVVPELNRLQGDIVDSFREIHTPSALAGEMPQGPSFNVSLGDALSRLPIIADAVGALRLVKDPAPAAQTGQWLRSSWFAGGLSEASARAAIDAQFLRLGERALSRDRVGAALEDAGATVSAARLRALSRHAVTAPSRQDAVGWASYLSRALEILGWPGERPLGSRDFQAVEAFRGLLDRLAATGAVTAPHGCAQALARFGRLARETLFQPRSAAAPVQIMGLLESGGLDFTHLWVLGLDDEVWPPPARPHPLIPAALQRSQGMPNSSPEWMLDYARRELTRLRGSARECVFSHARERDGRALRPSALLDPIDRGAADALPMWGSLRPLEATLAAAPVLEAIEDGFGPALEDGEPVLGGTRIFTDQLACPFRAFAIHRLGAVDVESPQSAVDARVRGLLSHRVLEFFWKAVPGQRVLLDADTAALDAAVERAVDGALVEAARERPGAFGARFTLLERSRLRALLLDWLEVERARASFEVVAPERGRSESVAGLPVAIRPDRIDRLADGTLFVIDYKTGRPALGQWLGDRPDDPQLPVYVLALDAAGGAGVSGAAFAVLDTARLALIGLADAEDVAPGVVRPDASRAGAVREVGSWSELKTRWANTLETAGRGFRAGDARVDPKSLGGTCQFCAVAPLCRVAETRGAPELEANVET